MHPIEAVNSCKMGLTLLAKGFNSNIRGAEMMGTEISTVLLGIAGKVLGLLGLGKRTGDQNTQTIGNITNSTVHQTLNQNVQADTSQLERDEEWLRILREIELKHSGELLYIQTLGRSDSKLLQYRLLGDEGLLEERELGRSTFNFRITSAGYKYLKMHS